MYVFEAGYASCRWRTASMRCLVYKMLTLHRAVSIPQKNLNHFRATVCKTVRLMLSVRCPVCLSVGLFVCLSVCLSVTFLHCGQTVGRIKMKLGMQVGLGPGHIVLGGDPAPLP